MTEFIFLLLYRSLSGAQNGAGYASKMRLRVLMGTVMFLSCIIMIMHSYQADIPLLMKVVSSALCIAASAGVIGVEDGFNEALDVFPKDIHLYETITTGCITLAYIIAGGNLVLITASVYPGLIIHKGLINTIPGGTFWRTGTDDPTGKTFSIPLLNLKVPRSTNLWRITMAMVSILAAIVAYFWQLDWTIYTLL